MQLAHNEKIGVAEFSETTKPLDNVKACKNLNVVQKDSEVPMAWT